MAGRTKKGAGTVKSPAPGDEVVGSGESATNSETPVTSNSDGGSDAGSAGSPTGTAESGPDDSEQDANAEQVDQVEQVQQKVILHIQNTGHISRFEPLTKTPIPAGSTVRIETDDVERVRKNILQINVLARRKVLSEVDE